MQDFAAWRLAVDAIALVALMVSLGAGAYAWRLKRDQVTRASLDAIERRQEVIETRFEALPGQVAWQRLADQIGTLSVDVRGLQAEIHGHGAGLKRVENQVGLLLENAIQRSES